RGAPLLVSVVPLLRAAGTPPPATAPHHTTAATTAIHLNVVIRASSWKCVLRGAIRLQEEWADNAHKSRQRRVSTRSQTGRVGEDTRPTPTAAVTSSRCCNPCRRARHCRGWIGRPG